MKQIIKITLIKITIWIYNKLGYTVTITKGINKGDISPRHNLEIYTNGRVGI